MGCRVMVPRRNTGTATNPFNGNTRWSICKIDSAAAHPNQTSITFDVVMRSARAVSDPQPKYETASAP